MLRIEQEKNLCRVHIEGEMTIYKAAALKEQLMPLLLNKRPLEINLSKVSEIDSAGIQLMMLAKKQRAANRSHLTLTNHSAAVLDVFELMDLAGYFNDPVLMPGDQAGKGDRDGT